MNSDSPTVVILGAGINGCALARELVLNRVNVWVVDSADLCTGATSGSSRLIHGGLRYLEYGELDLVRESLAERTRLLRLAPQFVRPLELSVPVRDRLGGAWQAIGRFIGWRFWPGAATPRPRGSWLVQTGLGLYDFYAHDPILPKHRVVTVAESDRPRVDRRKYRWLCNYFDAQVAFPERLVIAMLTDAQEIAAGVGVDVRVLNYHQASLDGTFLTAHPLGPASDQAAWQIEPQAIVNATGAWVDHTLAQLHVPAKRLIGGTKGTHFFTFNSRLRDALGGQGIYAEADDGRPIFITPLADCVLVGTTDDKFEGLPEDAVATPEELAYLLRSLNAIVPDARLTDADIDFHTCAVRPLPFVDAKSTAAITRRHLLVRHEQTLFPMFSIVGGKLTTMRSLAETTAAAVLQAIGRQPTANSENRMIPGGESYPADDGLLAEQIGRVAAETGLPAVAVHAAWRLFGTRTKSVLDADTDRGLLADVELPVAAARWSISQEAARTLADLVERRLMLLYHPRLSRACLAQLSELLVETGHLPRADATVAVILEVDRLAKRYGRHVL